MMPYKGIYLKVITFLVKKPMKEEFGSELTKKVLKASPAIYKDLLSKVEDIGQDNPMAANIYMCFVFFAIWRAGQGSLTLEGMRNVTRKMMAAKMAQKMIAGRNMNIPEDYAKGRAKMERAKAWADEHPEYKDKTWDINFDDTKHKDGYFYYFTRCPINDFARKYDFMDILPVCCELDHLITQANHGVLIRDYTLAQNGALCDYWLVPDQIKNPQ
ncbi:MAG: L-2-amino-thiazoline-4-carboxylic acid hydrolase [Treponema sp.]|nr:L-2-amino-thiazoline-4-carboxylic acid hydrolase [Treponema sp.]